MFTPWTDDDISRRTPRTPERSAAGEGCCEPLRLPKYAALRDALARQILGGDIRCGEKLPSETALGQRFEVSRVTVRHALESLRQAGLVESRQGRGHYARRVRIDLHIDRLLGLTEALGPAGIRIGAKVLSAKTVKGRPSVREDLELDPDDPVVRLVRLRRLANRPVCLESRFVRPLPGRDLLRMDLSDADMHAVYEHELGIELGFADVKVDHVGASATAAKILRVSEGAVLLRLRHLVYDDGARPLEICERLCPPQDFTLRVRAGRG